jgi:hypothetical protein
MPSIANIIQRLWQINEMSMEQRWNYTDRGKTKYREKTLSQHHSVHTSHTWKEYYTYKMAVITSGKFPARIPPKLHLANNIKDQRVMCIRDERHIQGK